MTVVDLNDPMYEYLRDDRVFLEDLYEDQHINPGLPWSLASTRERDQLAGALRQLAELIASRHDLPIPKDSYTRLDIIDHDGRRVAEITHGPGGYRFQVLPGAFEQTTDPPDAARLAAVDLPAAPIIRIADAPSARRGPRRIPPAKRAIRTGGRQ